MEHVNGITLSQLLSTYEEELTIPLPILASIIKQIVTSLHYLHNNNIIHRDIKSSNIMIDSNGQVKLSMSFLIFSFSL